MSRFARRSAIRVVAATPMATAVAFGATGIARADTTQTRSSEPGQAVATRSAQPSEDVTPVERPEDAVAAVREAGPKTWAVLAGEYRYPNGQVHTLKIDLETLDGVKVFWKAHYDSTWLDTDDPNIDQPWRRLTRPWYKIVPVPLGVNA